MANTTNTFSEFWEKIEEDKDLRDLNRYLANKRKKRANEQKNLTDIEKQQQVREWLENVQDKLTDPNNGDEVDQELFYQENVLYALHLRMAFDNFMATLGYKHVRSPEI